MYEFNKYMMFCSKIEMQDFKVADDAVYPCGLSAGLRSRTRHIQVDFS